jgi:hypothetical protein
MVLICSAVSMSLMFGIEAIRDRNQVVVLFKILDAGTKEAHGARCTLGSISNLAPSQPATGSGWLGRCHLIGDSPQSPEQGE